MAYTAWSVVAFETPTAAKWNQLGDNDALFHNFVGDDVTKTVFLGKSEITSNFSTTNTTETNVTGLSLTVTIPNTGRSLLLVVYSRYFVSSAAGGTFIEVRLKESTTRLQNFIYRIPASDYGTGVSLQRVLEPSAGSHTYYVAIIQPSAGTAVLQASATEPAFIAAFLV